METIGRKHIYGIDFSGAQDAGKWIWVASGIIEEGLLRIESCIPAVDLPGSGRTLEASLIALRNLVKDEGRAVLGFDFPFGLPANLVDESNWEQFVLAFPSRYSDPDAFRKACRDRAGPPEQKRRTDKKAKTPMSSYNLRLYKQTFYGIRDLLEPLVRKGLASVLPMQQPIDDRPWVIEICPASTLKTRGLPISYKKRWRGGDPRQVRQGILQALEDGWGVVIESQMIRNKILDNSGGDALDSVIAASAVHQALGNLTGTVTDNPLYRLEGFVYV